jgi:hypothetical protein
MGFGETVHIVPLGFEDDRVTRPFEKTKPNRVYLLVTPPIPKYTEKMNEKQKYFNERVAQKLSDAKIEFKFIEVDLFDVYKVMNKVATLIKGEKGADDHGSKVLVNMSAAGKLTAVGATLAAMAQGAETYYVFADDYSKDKKEEEQHGFSICTSPENSWWLPKFKIEMPEERLLKVLAIISKKKECTYTDELLKPLIKEDSRHFKDAESLLANKKPQLNHREEKEFRRRILQENLNNLHRGILNKLKKGEYIGVEKDGKYSKVWITESGKCMVALNGLLE